MKFRFLPILRLLAAPAFADTFGRGANTFTMDFVTIGNANNLERIERVWHDGAERQRLGVG